MFCHGGQSELNNKVRNLTNISDEIKAEDHKRGSWDYRTQSDNLCVILSLFVE